MGSNGIPSAQSGSSLKRRLPRLEGTRQIVPLLETLGLDFRRRHESKGFNVYDPRLGRRKGACQSFWLREEENLRVILLEAHEKYRELAKAHHPDKGGDPSVAAAINIAWQRVQYLFAKRGIIP